MGVFGVPSVWFRRHGGVRASVVVATVATLLLGTAVAVSVPAGASAVRRSASIAAASAVSSARKPLPVSAPLADDRAAGGRADGTTGPAGESLGTRVLPATVTRPQGPRRGAALD
ncbi:MAG: hypothetical protein M3N95_07055, partial [Actinomycetota bacterium]|nr:hypothetical protein [Actinomycetota bacterium]